MKLTREEVRLRTEAVRSEIAHYEAMFETEEHGEDVEDYDPNDFIVLKIFVLHHLEDSAESFDTADGVPKTESLLWASIHHYLDEHGPSLPKAEFRTLYQAFRRLVEKYISEYEDLLRDGGHWDENKHTVDRWRSFLNDALKRWDDEMERLDG